MTFTSVARVIAYIIVGLSILNILAALYGLKNPEFLSQFTSRSFGSYINLNLKYLFIGLCLGLVVQISDRLEKIYQALMKSEKNGGKA